MKRKIIFSLCIAILVLFGALSAVFLYLHHNPDYVKSLLAREISRYAKSSLTIGDLSYSLHPLKIRARGIVFSPLDKGSGFHLQIPDLIADMTLEGPFGHKTLILKSLKMTRFQLRLSKDISILNILPEAGDSSLFSKGLKIIVAFFFFKDVQFQGAELIDGLIALQLKDQEVQATGIHLKTETDRSLTVSGSITLTVPSQNMRFEAPDVHMKTDGAFSFGNPQLRFFLTAHEMTLYSPKANVKTMSAMTTVIYDFSHKKMVLEPMEMHLHGLTLKHDPDRQTTFQNPEINIEGVDLKAKLTYEQDLKGLSFESMDLDLQGITLKQEPGKKSLPLNMNLKASGILSLLDHRMGSSISNLSVDKVLRLNGNLNAEFGKRTAIGLEVKEFNLSPQRIRDFLPSKVRKALDPFQLEAPLSLHGHVEGIKGQQQWEWDCNLKIQVKESPYSFTFEEFRLHGDMSGEIHASGKFPAGNISGRLDVAKTVLSAKGVEMDPSKAEVLFSFRWPLLKVNDLKIQIPRLRIRGKEEDTVIDDIRLHAVNGHMNGEKRSLVFQEIRLHSSLVKNIHMAVEANGKKIVIQLQGEDVNLVRSPLLLNALPSGWRCQGNDSIQLKAESKEQDVWDVKGMIGLKALAFQNQEGTIAGEKIDLVANTAGIIDLRRNKTEFHASLEAKKGELLYDRFYLNLNQTPLLLSTEGQYESEKGLLSLSSAKMVLEGILPLRAHGQLLHSNRDPQIDLSVELPDTPLKGLFHHFVLEPFKTETPFLSRLTMSGNISGDFRIRYGSKDRSVKGQCLWRGGDLSFNDGAFSFKGIYLNLPIWYRDSGSPFLPGKGRKGVRTRFPTTEDSFEGRLTIDSIVLPLLPEQPFTIPLEVKPNQLFIRSGIPVRLTSGHLSLGPLVASDIFGPGLSIDTSLIVDALALSPFLSQIGAPATQGTLSGKLAPLHYEKREVTTQGEVKVTVFGGEIIISDVAASGILTPAPVFRLSARWDDMDLAEMTTGTSFGKIEGVLRGYIHDLEMAYGQPQGFDLLLETVKKSGISQRISIKAVENIAQIGGGQTPFMGLAGTFAAFFKNFPYEKIGIRASLGNDVFQINGTVKEDGVEYLIKRGSFSGVNVVNQNPDNRIRFKDMVKRIKRINASKGKPVIK